MEVNRVVEGAGWLGGWSAEVVGSIITCMTQIRYDRVDNLDNSLSYASAPKSIKCIYYAFGNAVSLTADEVYNTNKKLITADCNWDDTGMVVKLAHRYGFRIHPAILTIAVLPERFKDPTEELIIIYRKSGAYIPDTFKGIQLTAADIRRLLTDKAYEDIGFHAIYGTVTGGKPAITFKDQDGNHNPLLSAECIVFVRTKKK